MKGGLHEADSKIQPLCKMLHTNFVVSREEGRMTLKRILSLFFILF